MERIFKAMYARIKCYAVNCEECKAYFNSINCPFDLATDEEVLEFLDKIYTRIEAEKWNELSEEEIQKIILEYI